MEEMKNEEQRERAKECPWREENGNGMRESYAPKMFWYGSNEEGEREGREREKTQDWGN